MTDLPQWAVDAGERLWGGSSLDIARALAEAATPKWRADVENMPIGRQILLAHAPSGTVIASSLDIPCDTVQMLIGWEWAAATHWAELPAAPEVG